MATGNDTFVLEAANDANDARSLPLDVAGATPWAGARDAIHGVQ
jgi:hypothetical protein